MLGHRRPIVTGFRGSQRPNWPFAINRDSPQSQGLVSWMPLGYQGNGTEIDPYFNGAWANTGSTAIEDPGAAGFGLCKNYVSASSQFEELPSAVLTAVPLTISVWFYFPLISPLAAPVCITNNGGSSLNGFRVTLNSTGSTVSATTGNGTTTTVATTTTAFTAKAWYHACTVFADVASRAAYLNGGGKGTGNVGITPTGLNVTTIGSQANSVHGNFMNGYLADVRFYNYALSDDDVYRLFDPATRWDLYWQPRNKMFSFGVPAAVGGIAPKFIPERFAFAPFSPLGA